MSNKHIRNRQRFDRRNQASVVPQKKLWRSTEDAPPNSRNVRLDCGWGRLLFAHTFDSTERLVSTLQEEQDGARDIALYIRDPHVVLSLAPQELFLDPSHTFRLWLHKYRTPQHRPKVIVRRLLSGDDAKAINKLYRQRQIVPVDVDFIRQCRQDKTMTYLVAEDPNTRKIVGSIAGIDHKAAWDDPENGASFWCLAVDPNTTLPGVGQALVNHIAEHYLARGRAYLDLSVMHNNQQAIRLYEKLGFERVPVFCVKRKNPINKPLFMGVEKDDGLNPYAAIIAREARHRGIHVRIENAEKGFLHLSHGGRELSTRESLSELTSAVAMSRCDDKHLTQQLLRSAKLCVPAQRLVDDSEDDLAFIEQYKTVVVKPLRGEQGNGVAVELSDHNAIQLAIERAKRVCEEVLLEEHCVGKDLRIVVINGEAIAAAERKPPVITGTGNHSVRQLIEFASRRREAATDGEATIPLDQETERCIAAAGFTFDDIPPEGTSLTVRKTANLHTGGTLIDVTSNLHPALASAAIKAAEIIDIPVVGIDMLVPDSSEPNYVIIEANERPGLANHEPQPTAERFIDLLFPETART